MNYQTLGEHEIRVFHLMPGDFSDPLRGYLEHVTLSNGHWSHSTDSEASSVGETGESRVDDVNTDGNDEEDSEREDGQGEHGEGWEDETHFEDDENQLQRKVGPYWCPVHTALDPVYEALSYAWGDPEKTREIHMNDGSVLKITRSLFEALIHLRFQEGVRVLWADAICINQANLEEKDSQVSRMADIYRESGRTLIWLGQSESSDPLAFATIKVCRDLFLEKPTGLSESDLARLDSALSALLSMQQIGDRYENTGNLGLQGLLAAADLLYRPWFSRLWVFQEYKVSTKVEMHCGQLCCLMGEFNLTSMVMYDLILGSDPDLWCSKIDQRKLLELLLIADKGRSARPRPMTAWKIILATHSRQCSDPLDRIYAIRDIATLDTIEELRPDYAIDSLDLYRAFVAWTLSEVQPDAYLHPAIALAVVGTEHYQEEWTSEDSVSWVADLNKLSLASECLLDLYHDRLLGQSQGFVQGEPRWNKLSRHFDCFIGTGDSKELTIRARVFATVTEAKPCGHATIPLDTLSSETVKQFIDLYTYCYQLIVSCSSSDQQAKASVLRNDAVLFLGYNLIYGRNGFNQDILHLGDAFLQHARSHWPFSDCIDAQESRHLLANLQIIFYYTQYRRAGFYKRLCQIRGDAGTDVAWLPSRTKVGDKVCVFAGTPWPWAVRVANDGTYTLLGDGHTYSTPLLTALGGSVEDLVKSRERVRTAPLGLNMYGPGIDKCYGKLDWIRLR